VHGAGVEPGEPEREVPERLAVEADPVLDLEPPHEPRVDDGGVLEVEVVVLVAGVAGPQVSTIFPGVAAGSQVAIPAAR
jgi:hypothetical protein